MRGDTAAPAVHAAVRPLPGLPEKVTVSVPDTASREKPLETGVLGSPGPIQSPELVHLSEGLTPFLPL